MSHSKLKCGHTVLDPDCKHCKALQRRWYKKLERKGFQDIEYGHDNPSKIYQPVPIQLTDDFYTFVERTEGSRPNPNFYDLVWKVYHRWEREGRSQRDLAVCELLAKQEGKTGTVRGICAYLKANKLKPCGNMQVQRTIKEIKRLIADHNYA